MDASLTIEGHRLAYTTAGSVGDPAVIMVHGWLSHRGVWRQTLPALSDRNYCVAIDLLGFGDSDKPAGVDYSIEAQGRRILQAADALGLDRLALLGHSMGGQIVLNVAARLAPRRVTHVVSIAGVVTGKLSRWVEQLTCRAIVLGHHFPKLYDVVNPLFVKRRRLAYFNFRPWFYRMDALPFEAWEIDRRMAVRSVLRYSAKPAGDSIRRTNLAPDLANITAPALAIFGRQDGTVPPSEGQLIAQRVPAGQLAVLDRCGHFPMYEQTEDYLTRVKDFLSA
jgi:pimeloyl-ACP methyl ester carboxylesterase